MQIEPLLPGRTPRRGRWRDRREVIDAIAWKFQAIAVGPSAGEARELARGQRGQERFALLFSGAAEGWAHTFNIMVAPPQQFLSGVSRPVSR